MSTPALRDVASAVVRRAQRRGFVLASEIREELDHTQLPRDQWKEVVSLSGDALRYRQGRYYYNGVVSPQLRQEQERKRTVESAVRQIIRDHQRTQSQAERRQQGRMEIMQPVKVRLENGQELTLLSRDLSTSGIRLLGSMSLLGQKVELEVPQAEAGSKPLRFRTRILWTCAVGTGLYENGGNFVELAAQEQAG